MAESMAVDYRDPDELRDFAEEDAAWKDYEDEYGPEIADEEAARR